jgi:hypothetical protein
MNDNAFKAVGAIAKPADRLVSCGDLSCEYLIDPIPRPTPDAIHVTVKPKAREVVLIDNNKPNSMAIMQATHALLRDRGIKVKDEIWVKTNASLPMPDDQMTAVLKEPGLIVGGIND